MASTSEHAGDSRLVTEREREFVSNVRTMVEMLMEEPAQMTPHAAGCLIGLCAEHEATDG